jgi:transcriptional regulator with GAF, ATPase, and Fis domain
MARLSRTGGKASKARVRKASPAKGRETTNTAKAKTTKAKTTKTRRRIVLETGPRKPRSVSDLVAQLDLRTKQLDESLAQQTATGEILTVINGSAGNLAPVFDIILEKAHSLCGVTTGSLELYEGDIARSVAARGMNKRWEKYLREGYRITEALRPAYQSLRPGHVDDMRKIVERFPDEPTYRAFVEIGHLRTFLALPLVRDDIVIGRIVAARAEVEPFTDGQIKLLQSFADQAVIAIDNVRLFNETKEALEQQKASADILSVISNSVADTQPVFDKILESCKHLFGGDELDVLLVDEQ